MSQNAMAKLIGMSADYKVKVMKNLPIINLGGVAPSFETDVYQIDITEPFIPLMGVEWANQAIPARQSYDIQNTFFSTELFQIVNNEIIHCSAAMMLNAIVNDTPSNTGMNVDALLLPPGTYYQKCDSPAFFAEMVIHYYYLVKNGELF